MKVSKTGYKKNSKDKNQPSLLIPSSRITMKDVEFPVLGIDNYGNQQIMMPGGEYSFPGNYVYEKPMKNWLDKFDDGGATTDCPCPPSCNCDDYLTAPRDATDYKVIKPPLYTNDSEGIIDNETLERMLTLRRQYDQLRAQQEEDPTSWDIADKIKSNLESYTRNFGKDYPLYDDVYGTTRNAGKFLLEQGAEYLAGKGVKAGFNKLKQVSPMFNNLIQSIPNKTKKRLRVLNNLYQSGDLVSDIDYYANKAKEEGNAALAYKKYLQDLYVQRHGGRDKINTIFYDENYHPYLMDRRDPSLMPELTAFSNPEHTNTLTKAIKKFIPTKRKGKFETGGSTKWLDRFDVGGTSDCDPGYVKNWAGQCVPILKTNADKITQYSLTEDVKQYEVNKEKQKEKINQEKIKREAELAYYNDMLRYPQALARENLAKDNVEYEKILNQTSNPGTIQRATEEQTAELMSDGPSYAYQVQSDKKAKPLIENNPQGDRTNQEWLASFKPEDQETLKYSTYASMFEPELWKQSLQGLESLGRWTLNNSPVGLTYRAVVDPLGLNNTNLINTPFYTAPGYTEETAREVNPLQTLAVLGYPQRAVQGMLTGSSLLNPQPYFTYNNYGGSDINTMNIAASLASDPLMIPEVGALPFKAASYGLKGLGAGYRGLNNMLNASRESGLFSNTSKYNPWRFKSNNTFNTSLGSSHNAGESMGYGFGAGDQAAIDTFENIRNRKLASWQTAEGKMRLQNMIDNTSALQGQTPELFVDRMKRLENLSKRVPEARQQLSAVEEQINAIHRNMDELDISFKNNELSQNDYFDMIASLDNQLITLGKQHDHLFNVTNKPGAGAFYMPHGMYEGTQSAFLSGVTLTPADLKNLAAHEVVGHSLSGFGDNPIVTNLDTELGNLTLKNLSDDVPLQSTNPQGISNFYYEVTGPGSQAENQRYWSTGSKGTEKVPFLQEVKEDMLSKGIITEDYGHVTPEMLEKHYADYMATQGEKYPLRVYDMMQNDKSNFSLLSRVMNKLPSLTMPLIGTGTIGTALYNLGSTQEKKLGGATKWLDRYQDGGPLPKGAWGQKQFGSTYVAYTDEPNTIYIADYEGAPWRKVQGADYDKIKELQPIIFNRMPERPAAIQQNLKAASDKANADNKKTVTVRPPADNAPKVNTQPKEWKEGEVINLGSPSNSSETLSPMTVFGNKSFWNKVYDTYSGVYNAVNNIFGGADLPDYRTRLNEKFKEAREKGKLNTNFNRLAGFSNEQARQIYAEEQMKKITDFYNGKNDQYLVLDKSSGLLHLYQGKNLIKSYNAGTGKNMGDEMTRTVVDNQGNVLWDKGNFQTGAGIYTTSRVNPKDAHYSNAPTWNFLNEQGNEVPMAIHSAFGDRVAKLEDSDPKNNRFSSGCINGLCYDLTDLYQQGFGVGEKLYVLPDSAENQFVIDNGNLTFTSSRPAWEVNKTPIKYKPLTFNFDENKFRDEVFQSYDIGDESELENTTRPFINSLQNNKEAVMKAAQIDSNLYDELAKMAFGIYGAESNYGDTHGPATNVLKAANKWLSKKIGYTASSPDYESKYTTYSFDEPEDSAGLIQFKWKHLNDREKTALSKLGITSNADFLDPEKAAKAVVTILGIRYWEQLDKEEKKDIWKNLPRTYNKAPNYADRVKKNADRYLSFQKRQGGSTNWLDVGLMQPEYKKGGVKTSAEGYYDYINGYKGVSLSKGGPSKKGWLEKYK